MLYENWFKNPGDAPLLLEKIAGYSQKTGPIRLMEVCGTHTMSIARSGIKSILPENVQLLSGPGCPVCVTPANIIDMILSLSKRKEILIASYGDLLRVPGSIQGESLLKRRAGGANVESVYSPMDALQLAEDHPKKRWSSWAWALKPLLPGRPPVFWKQLPAVLRTFPYSAC